MSNCFVLSNGRESLLVNVLTSLVAVLSALILALMLVSSALALGNGQAETRELAPAHRAANQLRRTIKRPTVLISDSTSSIVATPLHWPVLR